jgi:hypothetical protein
MLEQIKAYAKLIGAVLWIITVLGAYFYRAHQDAGDVKAALDSRALIEQDAISKAYEKGQADSTELATAQQNRAKQAEQDLAKEKADHANDIRNSHAALVAAAGKCTVRRSDVSVLDTAAVPRPSAPAATATAGQQRDDTGSVAASAIIETCERAKFHFDANIAKLEQCVAAYNDARAKLTPKEKP